MRSPEIVRLGERYNNLKMLRSGHESMLEDAQKYVSPNRAEFRSVSMTTGARNQDPSPELYDHTAIWANQMFANGMSSYLMPKSDRWAYLKPEGTPSADLTDDELLFLEQLSNKVQHLLGVPAAQFYTAGHETFHDLGSFGTAVVYVNRDKPVLSFKSCPLADTFFDTNPEGVADTMYYRKYLSTKALIQQFPDVVNVKGFDPDAVLVKHEVIYSVEPSLDARAKKGGKLGAEKPFKATYWLPSLDHILKQGGMTYFPFLVPRWMVVSGDTWGRGPATTCLAQIRVINKMVKELLKSAEISNAPPLVAEEDSIMLPIAYGSRQILFHEQGANPPTALVSGSQPQITLEMLRDYREQITRSFFVDQIIRDQKKERQSIVEIQDERGQMLQQIGPLLARMETEYLAPAMEHAISFLQEKQPEFFKDMPSTLEEKDLEIVFTSPAAHAQYASGIGNISGFLQDIAPLLQYKPELMDNINDNELFEAMARMRNVGRKIVATKDQVGEIREQRAEVEGQQQQMAALPEMAGAMKDVATAKATDPDMGSLLGM